MQMCGICICVCICTRYGVHLPTVPDLMTNGMGRGFGLIIARAWETYLVDSGRKYIGVWMDR